MWGGDAEHVHDFEDLGTRIKGGVGQNKTLKGNLAESRAAIDGQQIVPLGSSCACGAWLGSLGLEPTPEAYIEHLCEVFREVWRVLRPDGTVWLNLGDSYAGSGNGQKDRRPSEASLSKRNQHARPDVNGWYTGSRYDGQSSPAYGLGAVPGYKPKDLMLLPWRVAMALQQDGWWIRSVIPWLKRNCLSGGTRLYVRSQKGEMPMTVKDLARLDPTTCKLWNGERWTQLVSMWELPRGEGDDVEIELRSGERIGCTPDHRWPTERGLLRAYELTVGDVLKGSWLPKPETRQPAGLADGQIGWFVGLYIAEGSMSGGTIQIASHVKETARFETLKELAAAYDGTCRAHLRGGQSMTINLTGEVLRGILKQYVAGRTAKDKHLTNRCWMRSNEFLSGILSGYLHGDGHYDEQNARWRLGFTRNYAWEGDLRTIAARLNIDLRLKKASIPYAGRQVPIFRGSLRFERTTKLWTKNEREIVRIGRSRGRKFWDIAVEDEPHTFALASGVFTHNSMPESVTDRPATATEHVFLLAKSKSYYWDADAVRIAHAYDWSANAAAMREQHKNRTGKAPLVMAGGKDNRYSNGPNENGRSLRNTDFFFQTWQGLMLDEHDDPLALVVNPQPFKQSHFATFPPKLVEPMIKAGTSEKGCCPACGAPWRRMVERKSHSTTVEQRNGRVGHTGPPQQSGWFWTPPETTDRGWQPTCTCPPADPVPCTVLDPFGGSGTVGLVADRLGRDAILCELKPDYGSMAVNRVTSDAPLFVEIDHDGLEPQTPEHLTDKQSQLGKRTYTGFNARWDAKKDAP